MKRYLILGLVSVLLLVGCGGKNNDNQFNNNPKKDEPIEEKKEEVVTKIACKKEVIGQGKEIDYGYVKNGTIYKLDGILTLEDQNLADQYCQRAKQNATGSTKVSCSGKSITVEDVDNTTLIGKTAEEFIEYYETSGWTCTK